MPTVPLIDLGTSDIVYGQVPVRKLISLVLLLAVKDRATEVRFVPWPADGEWKLCYEVAGEWFDMVPVPLDVPISQEVRRLGGMRSPSSWWNLFGWPGTNEGTIRLRIAGQTVEVTASLHRESGQRLETVALRLPQTTGAADDAARLLSEYFEKWRDEQAPGIAFDGAG